MSLQGTFALLCSLAVLSSSAAQDHALLLNCISLQAELLERLSADVKVAAECGDILPSAWTTQESAALLISMRRMTDILHTHLQQDCQGKKPKECPAAEVPLNGGLVCATVANKRYCKPMCDHGYDFAVLRRSRLYDECSEQTKFKWQSQYVGGNKLAECQESRIQVAGAKSAYFHKDQDCLTTKANAELQCGVITKLISELMIEGLIEEAHSACLVCG